MNVVDSDRTVCLEDITTMKQKNNWCSWCVRVFVGGEEGDWKTCGVGILTFRVGNKNINTVGQLKALMEASGGQPDSVILEASVKKQEGLNSPSEKDEASPEIKKLMSGQDDDANNYLMRCNLKEAANFEWEKSKLI